MSATLRHDISRELAAAIWDCDFLLLAAMGGRESQIWAGIRNGGHRPSYTFAAKLPGDVRNCVALLDACGTIQTRIRDIPSRVRNSAHTLAAKFIVSLGLPFEFWLDEEAGFLASIEAAPGELTNWSAYADWLVERGEKRGEVMQGWLAKKAVKTKYGVPLTAHLLHKRVHLWRTMPPIFSQEMGPAVAAGAHTKHKARGV